MLTKVNKGEVNGETFEIREITDEFYNNISYTDILINMKSISDNLIKYVKENTCINGMTIVIDDRYADNIEILKNFNWIMHLFLGTNSFRSIEVLSIFDKLESLYLEGASKEAFDFSLLPMLLKLTILYHEKITNGIFKCTKLEYLRISHYKHKSKTIDEISTLGNLKILEIKQATIINVDALSMLKKLEILELSYIYKLEDIKGLKDKESIRNLTIQNCKKINNWEIIGSLKNLKKIYICSCGIIPSINFLKNVSNLEEIHIADTKVEDGKVASICENKNLKEFNIQTFEHYDVTEEQVSKFNDKK